VAPFRPRSYRVTIPGLGGTNGIFVLGDGTRLFSSTKNMILQLTPSGRLATIAGNKVKKEKLKDGQGISASFNAHVA
jgi:hypothetical protein